MKLLVKLAVLIFVLLHLHSNSEAQNKLKFDFDQTGKTYIKLALRSTTWLRYTDLNPDSKVNNEVVSDYVDFSIRRFRLSINSQATEQLYFSLLLGGNNLNIHSNNTFHLRIIDLYTEYELNKAFTFGVGKSGWQGLSRWDIRSSKSIMSLDAPLFTLNTVDKNDDIGRLLGIFAKGQFSNFDYRFVLNQPLSPSSTTLSAEADFANNAPRLKTSSYIKYQFWDHESNKSPYTTGTYLGKKKVLALGIGFMTQPKAMWSKQGSDTLIHHMFHWSADVFLDLPIKTSEFSAITSSISFTQFNFGPNYIRNVGANNPSNGLQYPDINFNGAGNSFPMIGTGSTWFANIGYLFPQSFLGKEHGQIQPNFAVQYANWDYLDDPMIVYDFGINWYLNGHDHKITLGYQHRPLFKSIGNQIKQDSYKGMWVLQYQFELN